MRRKVGILLAMSLAILALAAGPVLALVIDGTDRDDTLVGTVQADQMSGLAGKDVMLGRGGKDRMMGGDGDDELVGGPGGDGLYGGSNRDTLLGGPGSDFLNSVDRGQDFVNCGGDVDTAAVDPQDIVSSNCERVQVTTDQ